MPRAISLTDSQQALLATQRALTAQLGALEREEEYLTLKIRQAREQVRYYEGLLQLLRRDWGAATGITDLVRKLG
jgi:hypothetical protein